MATLLLRIPAALLLAVLSPAALAGAVLDDAVFLGQWGRKSLLPGGKLQIPTANAVDSSTGEVYVVEPYRVQKWDRDGRFLLSWSCSCTGIGVNPLSHDVYVSRADASIARYTSSGQLIRSWGGPGSAPGLFDRPFGVSVDPTTGNVYVMDTGNRRAQVFDATGEFLREFTHSLMSGVGGQPAGVAFDPSSRSVWITDPINSLVLKFSEAGELLVQLGDLRVPGTALGKFRWPRSVAVDASGNAYVTDTDSERIQVFSPTGEPLGAFQGLHERKRGPFHPRDIAINLDTGEKYVVAAYAARIDKFDPSNSYLFSFGAREMGGPFFILPRGLAVSPRTGDIYVFDSGNFLIKRFTAGGTFLSEFGGSLRVSLTEPGLFGSLISSALTFDPDGNLWAGLVGIHYKEDPDLMFIQQFDPNWTHHRSFHRRSDEIYIELVRHLAVEPLTRNIWSADSRLRRVQKFDPNGTLLLEIQDVGTPCGIAYHDGNVYIAESSSHSIHRYDPNGIFLGKFGGTGSSDGKLRLFDSSGLTTDADGNIYVADTLNARVQKFDPNGTFLGKLSIPAIVAGQAVQPIQVALSPDSSILNVIERAQHRVLSYCLGGAGGLTACQAAIDFDADGHRDAEDNCPFVSNSAQADNGGLDTSLPDGIGDPCQCGEVTGDGRVAAEDLTTLRGELAGSGVVLPASRCSVSGGLGCDVLDASILRRALAGLGPGIQAHCSAADRPLAP